MISKLIKTTVWMYCRDKIKITIQTISDEDMASTRSWNADPIQVPIGPVTRARAKKFQNALNWLIQGIWAQVSTWRPIEGDERNLQPITNMIQVQESQ